MSRYSPFSTESRRRCDCGEYRILNGLSRANGNAEMQSMGDGAALREQMRRVKNARKRTAQPSSRVAPQEKIYHPVPAEKCLGQDFFVPMKKEKDYV